MKRGNPGAMSIRGGRTEDNGEAGLYAIIGLSQKTQTLLPNPRLS